MLIFSPLGKLAERAICFGCVNYLFFLRVNTWRPIIRGSTEPIFTIFSSDGRHLKVVWESEPLFPDHSRDAGRVGVGVLVGVGVGVVECQLNEDQNR